VNSRGRLPDLRSEAFLKPKNLPLFPLVMVEKTVVAWSAGIGNVRAPKQSAPWASRSASLVGIVTTARGFEPHVHLERAEFARLTGDKATCERELREAHRLFLEMGATIRAAEIAKELEG
jgi:hypothetical protein